MLFAKIVTREDHAKNKEPLLLRHGTKQKGVRDENKRTTKKDN